MNSTKMANLHTTKRAPFLQAHSFEHVLHLPTLYGNGPRSVHPKIPDPPDATRAPFITARAHRLDANQ